MRWKERRKGATERSDGDGLGGGEEKAQEFESQDGRLRMAQGRARDHDGLTGQ
jgi:hypothetical protein